MLQHYNCVRVKVSGVVTIHDEHPPPPPPPPPIACIVEISTSTSLALEMKWLLLKSNGGWFIYQNNAIQTQMSWYFSVERRTMKSLMITYLSLWTLTHSLSSSKIRTEYLSCWIMKAVHTMVILLLSYFFGIGCSYLSRT